MYITGESSLHKICSSIPLTDVNECPCNEYHLEPYGEWGNCIVNETSFCGTGVRYRAKACYNSYGQKIDPRYVYPDIIYQIVVINIY